MRIIIFGDSIAEGYSDYEGGGWGNRLKMNYMQDYLYERMVMNYGISAYTSENILNCYTSFFDAVSKREAGKEKDSVIVFAFGINDSAQLRDAGNKRVNLEKFEENIKQLIHICQSEELIQNIVFIGNINVDEDVINKAEGEYYFYNSEIQKYNEVIQKLANQTTCGYIDIFGIMDSEDLEDGLHPNSRGHEKIYKKVKEYLDRNL